MSLSKQPELPSLFSKSSIERALELAVLPSRLQPGSRNKIAPFIYALHSALVWSVSPRCVVLVSTPVFIYTTKVSLPYKDYHGKGQFLLLLSARIEFW